MQSEICNLKSAISSSALVLVLALVGCHGPGRDQLTGRASDEWVRSYPLTDGGEVQITNGNGAVDVQATDGDTVDVRAERIATASSDAAAAEILPRMNIQEEITVGKVALRTEPLGGIVIGVTTEVRYHVRAPKHALVRVRAVNGALTVKGFDGRVILNSVNGGVTAEGLSGGVEVRSTNGNAKIALAAFGNDLVDIRVTNGGLELALPATSDANLTASVTNGKIDVSALTFEPLGEQTARRIRGRLNAGGTPIELVATNGNILVKPSPAVNRDPRMTLQPAGAVPAEMSCSSAVTSCSGRDAERYGAKASGVWGWSPARI